VDTFAEFVKEFLIPGSSWFFILAATGGVVLLYGRSSMQRLGRLLLTGLVVMYWAMSLPPMARGLQLVKVPRPSGVRGPQSSSDAIPIVVLGNGTMAWGGEGAVIDVLLPQTGYNAIAAIERYRRFPDSTMIVSGGAAREGATPEAAVIRDALLKNGVRPDQIELEVASRNTHEQAIGVARLLRQRRVQVCYLATSPQHMARAVDLFRAEGIDVVPAVARSQLFSPLWDPSGAGSWWLWAVPSSEARAVSRDVVYEAFAWIYYRARGWVD
jgi:uncharacterized SAM-binding protein YcdF (DUF218 family)